MRKQPAVFFWAISGQSSGSHPEFIRFPAKLNGLFGTETARFLPAPVISRYTHVLPGRLPGLFRTKLVAVGWQNFAVAGLADWPRHAGDGFVRGLRRRPLQRQPRHRHRRVHPRRLRARLRAIRLPVSCRWRLFGLGGQPAGRVGERGQNLFAARPTNNTPPHRFSAVRAIALWRGRRIAGRWPQTAARWPGR